MGELAIQAIGGIALIFWVISIQTKSKIKILRFQNIANLFYGVQYIFLNAMSAVMMNLLSLIRGIIFVKNEKKNKDNGNALIIVFVVFTVIIGFFTFDKWYSLIPIVNTLGYSYSTWQKNTRIIRIIFVIAAILWVIYNGIVGAYIPLIGNIVEVISGIVAIIKFDIRKGAKNMNKELAVVVKNANENVTPFETIDTIKKVGFKNVFVEWYNEKWDISQEEQVKYVQKNGLNIIFAHLGYETINSIWEDTEEGEGLVERYKNDIKVCKENGISMVIMHLTTKKVAPKYCEIGLNRIRKIVDYARELGVKVALENTKIKGYLEYVMSSIKNDNLGLCFDVGHCHAHFKDDFNFEFFKNKIFAVHLHDNDGMEDLHLLPFDGTIDWKWAMEKLKEANYQGPITMELVYRNDYTKMSIKEFYEKAKQIGEQLGEM